MERVEALQAVRELAALPCPDSDQARCAWLAELHRAEAVLFGAKVRTFWAVEATRAYSADGSKTAGAWLARECHASRVLTNAQARLARRLRTMPVTMGTLSAGDIGEEHAAVLAKVAHSPRTIVAAEFGRVEEMLVGWARDLYFDDFLRMIEQWKQIVDQDGAEDEGDRSLDRRNVHLSETLDGEWRLDGDLDPVGGTIVDTALSRIERELRDKDRAEAREANGGEDPTDDQLERTHAQRRADALVEMAKRAMAMPKGARKPKPLVTVVVGLEDLKGRVCELFNGMPVAPGQVARLLDEAEVERVVFDGPKRVIEVGKRQRFFTGGLRRAIEVRDRHCQHPGCRAPAEWCQVDHIRPHSWGGETSQENGRLLCEYHNQWRVNGGKPKPATKPPEDEAA